MKIVVYMSVLIVTVADMVPHAGPYLALVASAMAVWGFSASPKTALSTIIYGIVMTVIYSPGFVLADLARGRPQPENLPVGVAQLADSVGALSTGTMPHIIGAGGAGGLDEITQLSMEATVALVLFHIAALVIGVRRNMAAKAAAEETEFVYD